jgi:hypothetical protein
MSEELIFHAFLDFRFPVPGALRSASAKRLEGFLRQHHQPGAAAKARRASCPPHQPAFQGAPVILRTKAWLAQTLGHQLPALSEELGASQSAVANVAS